MRLLPSPGLCRAAAIAVLAALTIGAPIAALEARTPGATPIDEIRIAGAPALHVERPGTGAGYDSAWIVFRTRPHLHVSRQVVVRVRGMSGRSYGAAGHPNCIRSTVIGAAKGSRRN